MSEYFTCPHCSTKVLLGAPACPECGSDPQTGWSKNANSACLYPDDEIETSSKKSTSWYKFMITIITFLTISSFLAYTQTWGIYSIPLLLLVMGIAYYIIEIHPKTHYYQEKQLYQKLLQKARGDKQLVERLIEYEYKRHPTYKKLQLIKDAITHWERDIT